MYVNLFRFPSDKRAGVVALAELWEAEEMMEKWDGAMFMEKSLQLVLRILREVTKIPTVAQIVDM